MQTREQANATTQTKPKTLLNVDANAKTVKGQKQGVLTGVMYLAPADLSGYNVCPLAILAGCKEPCLNTAGRGAFTTTQLARIARTRWFFEDRAGFMAQLVKEIEALKRKAERMGLKPAVRLNGTSDIQWENVRFEYEFAFGKVRSASVFELFPDVQFYDYTKIPNRTNLPANYHLTFSYSGAPKFKRYADKALDNAKRGKINVAVVFDSEAKVQDYVRSGASFKGIPVVDGDASDVRFADGKGVVVGLYAKGKAKKDTTGFVVRS